MQVLAVVVGLSVGIGLWWAARWFGMSLTWASTLVMFVGLTMIAVERWRRARTE